MKFCYSTLLLLLMASMLPCFAMAQDFSYDGNRWYEIEISVFTNSVISGPDSELNIPEKSKLQYPQQIRRLIPATEAFAIDFNPSPVNSGRFRTRAEFQEPGPTPAGPEYSPAADDFRLPDFNRDSFIALSSNYSRFTDINQRLSRSPEHRLLFHAVWRQPVLNRVQSSAVFVRGGERYGQHNELEGSIMASFNINRIEVDANLWLNQFSGASEENAPQWNLPVQAFPLPEVDAQDFTFNQDLQVSQVYHLQETRAMVSNVLHYLDHPALGVLVEVRPYQLPDDFVLD